MNIICLGGRTEGPAVAWDLVQAFLAAEFNQEERRVRRLAMVARLGAERNASQPPAPPDQRNKT